MNEEIRKFQESLCALEILDQLTESQEIKDAVIRDLAEQNR